MARIPEKSGIVVVDDEEYVRASCARALAESGRFQCLGSFECPQEFLTAVATIRPDLVLLDIKMAKLSGVECLKRLKTLHPDLKVIMISALHNMHVLSECIHHGATGFISKPFDQTQLLTAIDLALSGGFPMVGQITEDLHMEYCSPQLATSLRPRECQLLDYLRSGMEYKEIAPLMNMSLAAVKVALHRIYIKLNASNKMEAVNTWNAPMSRN